MPEVDLHKKQTATPNLFTTFQHKLNEHKWSSAIYTKMFHIF